MNKDQEIEAEVSKHLVLAGQALAGRGIFHIHLAETRAKEHSQYKEKYELSLKLIKSIHQVCGAGKKG